LNYPRIIRDDRLGAAGEVALDTYLKRVACFGCPVGEDMGNIVCVDCPRLDEANLGVSECE
jgi:hypothetical protein